MKAFRLHKGPKPSTAAPRGEKGVSVLIALFFILVCTLVSIVVISSASVNAERTRGYQQEQQSYLAKVSALDLVEGLIVDRGGESGIAVKKDTIAGREMYVVVTGRKDGVGIADWVCGRMNGTETQSTWVLTVDVAASASGAPSNVRPVTLEVTYGDSIRVRAYDESDLPMGENGSISNVSRTFVSHTGEDGQITWLAAGAS